MSQLPNRPITQKTGKSKRGQWTKAQRDYVTRAVSFGCLWCWTADGNAGTPAAWHHARAHATGMRPPHEQGIALCPNHHDQTRNSIHQSPTRVKALTGHTEQELVAMSQKMFGWVDA